MARAATSGGRSTRQPDGMVRCRPFPIDQRESKAKITLFVGADGGVAGTGGVGSDNAAGPLPAKVDLPCCEVH